MIDGAEERKTHPEWFNRNGQMDMSHPGVRARVRTLVQTLVEEWGYEYLKYDFGAYDFFDAWGPELFTPRSAFQEPNDQGVTGMAAYRDAAAAIRETAGKRARLLACNTIMPLTLGLADVYRIGDDVGDWERTFRYGVLSVSARWYMNARYWSNDPDCLLVREPFTIRQAQSWASLVALTCGAVFVSEDLTRLAAERLAVVKSCLPVYRERKGRTAGARPMDYLESSPPTLWRLHVSREFGEWDVVGVFNWGDKAITRTVAMRSLEMDEQTDFHLFEFWSGTYRGVVRGRFNVHLGPWSCAVLSMRRTREAPEVVGTSRHVTQGGVELEDVRWHPTEKSLRGSVHVVGGNPCDLFIHVPDKYRLKRSDGGETSATVVPEILSLRLASPVTRLVRWSLEFT
jgi:alpha-galactosidase